MNGGGAAVEATDAGAGERLPLPRHQDNSSNTNSATTTTTTPPTPLFERLVTEEVQELRAYVRMVEHQNRRLMELERVHGDLETRLEYESKQRQQLELTLEAREREWAERYQHLEMDRDQQKALVEAETIKNSKLIDQVYRKDQDIHRMLQRKVRWVLKVLVVFSFSGPFCVLGARSSLVYFGGGIFFFICAQYDNEPTRSTRNARNHLTTTEPPAAATRDPPPPPPNHLKSRHSPKPNTLHQNKTDPPPSLRGSGGNNNMIHKGPHNFIAEVGSAERVRHRNAQSLLMDMFGM
jgi:hypothetical protein